MNFCPNCGSSYNGETAYPIKCQVCHHSVWKRLDPVAVNIVPVWTHDKLGYLIGERGSGYALLGGFVEHNEIAEEAAVREMFEETNLVINSPRYFTSRNTLHGQLLIFMKCQPLDIAYVEKNFIPTHECPSYRIVTQPVDLIFPNHQDILAQQFDK